jgi:hypothetical protein
VGADEGPAGVEEMESVGDGLDGVMKGGDGQGKGRRTVEGRHCGLLVDLLVVGCW